MHSGKKVSRRIKASSKVRGYFRASFFPKVARVISNAAARSIILRFFLAISPRRFSYSICGAGNFSPRFLMQKLFDKIFLSFSGQLGCPRYPVAAVPVDMYGFFDFKQPHFHTSLCRQIPIRAFPLYQVSVFPHPDKETFCAHQNAVLPEYLCEVSDQDGCIGCGNGSSQ